VCCAKTVQRKHNGINYASRITMTTTVTLPEVGRKQEDTNESGGKMGIIRSRKRIMRQEFRESCYTKTETEGTDKKKMLLFEERRGGEVGR
jgi:hypothetical protein